MAMTLFIRCQLSFERNRDTSNASHALYRKPCVVYCLCITSFDSKYVVSIIRRMIYIYGMKNRNETYCCYRRGSDKHFEMFSISGRDSKRGHQREIWHYRENKRQHTICACCHILLSLKDIVMCTCNYRERLVIFEFLPILSCYREDWRYEVLQSQEEEKIEISR